MDDPPPSAVIVMRSTGDDPWAPDGDPHRCWVPMKSWERLVSAVPATGAGRRSRRRRIIRMIEPPRDAHEAFIHLGPKLKEISSLVGNDRWPSGERQLLADMLLGYFLGLACEYKRAGADPVHEAVIAGLRKS
jgi:hypothetical protein